MLRHFYAGSNIASEVVPLVYNAMKTLFPQAGHVIVAHDRKSPSDPAANPDADEDFSGSSAWRDLAQVSLHLMKSSNALQLHHTKSQVSALQPFQRLKLECDGTTISSQRPLATLISELWPLAPEKGDKAQWVADQLKVDRATIFRHKVA